MNTQSRILVLDCDSTLSSIEGIDELARIHSPKMEKTCAELTNKAMNGEIPLEDVYSTRLNLISPSQKDCDLLAKLYLKTLAPNAKAKIKTFLDEGWQIILLSGGLEYPLRPLARELEANRLYAVPIFFDEKGNYAGFDENFPTAKNGGKPEIIQSLKNQFPDSFIVMLGDGASDAETKGVADQFIAFTGFVSRPKVLAQADHSVSSFEELAKLLL